MEIKHKAALTRMAASVLRPLIKVLMRHGFPHSQLTELVRKTYVEVAYDSFSIPDRKMTYSRAAMLSGLSRKEVVRLRTEIVQGKSIAQQLSTAAYQVVQGWQTHCEQVEQPNKLDKLNYEGAKGSFTALVAKYAPNSLPQHILDELNKSGITSQSANGIIQLQRGVQVPDFDELEKIRVMSVCVSDLFDTAVHDANTTNNDIRFQRQLVYSGIEETLARKFHTVGSEKAMALFQTLNDFLFAGKLQSNHDSMRSGKRVGLGIYYFEDAKQVKSVKMTSEEHA